MRKLGLLGLAIAATLLFAVACDGRGDTPLSDDNRYDSYNDDCRFDPQHCDYGVGAYCNRNSDCDSGYCCQDDKNCGGGMCTERCDRDADCPSFMACEHKVCFFRCNDNQDCAVGQSCEHGNTVCEWP